MIHAMIHVSVTAFGEKCIVHLI